MLPIKRDNQLNLCFLEIILSELDAGL